MQLTLSLKLRDDATFANFFVGENGPLLECLRDPQVPFFYLWGAKGVGKTHVLQASCHLARSMYLSLAERDILPMNIFDGFENLHLLCLDDIEAAMGDAAWEEALFHCYNRARDNHVKVIVASSRPPKLLACGLPDLQSRLLSGVSFEMKALSDADLLSALLMRAKNRGIFLGEDVAQFLLRHYPRNMQDLYNILNKLDNASLEAKRKITIPFVKQVLQAAHALE
jgi:DnaA family protein